LLKVSDNGAVAISNDGIVINGQSISRTGSTKIQLGAAQLDYQVQIAHIFKTYNGTSYAEAMRITGNSPEQFVGIGETTPTARLHVKGSGNGTDTDALLVQNSDGDTKFRVQDDGTLTISAFKQLRAPGSTYSITLQGTTAMQFTSWAKDFTWTTQNGVITTLKNDGKLGLGETAPSAQLHVKAGTTQDVIARFQDPLNASSYIDIKNDSVLTNYTGIFWGSNAKIRSKEVGALFLDTSQTVTFADGNAAKTKIYSQGQISIGSSTIPASTMAYIKGSGTTSATTSLLVQNSAGNTSLEVLDNRDIKFNLGSYQFLSNGFTSFSPVYVNNNARIGLGGTGADVARLQVKGSGNDATTTALLVQNSDASELLKVTDDGAISASGNRLTIGEGSDVTLRILASGNASAGNNYIQPLGTPANQRFVVTGNSVATIKAVDLDASNVYIGYGINQTAATGTLSIKGSGTTSATTALLVQNSAGDELLKVRDDGNIYLSYSTNKSVLFPKYAMDSVRLHPLTGQNLGADSNTNFQFGSGFFNDKIHITDNVASNTTADASAKLQVDSTTKGFLPPRMTSGEKNAIASPAPGLMVYDTDANQMSYWNGGAWINF